MNAQLAPVRPTPDAPGGFVVRRPRPSDAAGAALRKAYDAAPGMSADLLRLMRELDRVA